MPSNHTPNYQLSQWERSDQVLMDDFNADNAKLDAALAALAEADGAEASARLALAAQVAKKGNCRIETFSYTGVNECGEEYPTVLTFSAQPAFFLVYGIGAFLFGQGNEPVLSLYNGGYSFYSGHLTTTWTGNKVSFYTDSITSQANRAYLYHVVAFYAEDET